MIRDPRSTLLIAGLATGIVDGLYACVLSLVYGSTPTRMFQGVASTLLGKSAYDGGGRAALIGVMMHFLVAFTWSAIFLLLVRRSTRIRRLLFSRGGIVKTAAVYGPLIWVVMSVVVIPLLVRRPPAINVRWWSQLLGHVVFVGLPIAASIAYGERPRTQT